MGQSQSAELLTLDANIRDWVVLPMFVIMVFVNLLRHYVQMLLKSDKQIDPKEIRYKQTLTRSSYLRRNGAFLSEEAWKTRKAYFTNKESGVLNEQGLPKGGMNAASMMNPMTMLDMMKGNITFIVPNMAMMAIINQFFQGFVLVKVPFSLTNRFKSMLHRGVDLSTLDVSYVSSLSWYFLLMFGLRGLIKLFLGENSDSLDEGRAYQAQMGMAMGGGGPGAAFNAEAAYKGEREQLEFVKLAKSGMLDDVEKRLLGAKYPACSGAGLEDEYTPSAKRAGGGAVAKRTKLAPKAGASGAPVRQKARK
mmetsp:Transcript_49755/g.113016  ORF Transcript_49755/g.113016 Transcript_49755/m.113016 type:complete len:307 (-) Transcript_49755:199-1119(-)|eukprot:CAMPEP_0172617430 /NCGR_PEP_ID=MMETSP1068-20121228/70245_1 /TAXON_ID=35684 /ORGANISM="Pseudopedinella elastica, Strain CCMP716" /LENGTH=306 /DNA_ID=CAMNT_0013423191 /DNA_START=116 /DNA_END=1036 /DNA_ORIENTATION=-